MTLRFGHGYDNPTSFGMTPCTAFDGFYRLKNPLGGFSEVDRARRVFTAWGQTKVTYGSHSVSLGRSDTDIRDTDDRQSGTLAVMMEHGGGRQLTPLRICQHRADIEAALLAMPEPALYFLLYAISETAAEAHRQGLREAEDKWTKAISEKRVRRRRGRLEIEDPYLAERRRERRASKAA